MVSTTLLGVCDDCGPPTKKGTRRVHPSSTKKARAAGEKSEAAGEKKRGQATAAGGRARPPPMRREKPKPRATFLSLFGGPSPFWVHEAAPLPPRLAFFAASLFFAALLFLHCGLSPCLSPDRSIPLSHLGTERNARARVCSFVSCSRSRCVPGVREHVVARHAHTHNRKKKRFFSGGKLFT